MFLPTPAQQMTSRLRHWSGLTRQGQDRRAKSRGQHSTLMPHAKTSAPCVHDGHELASAGRAAGHTSTAHTQSDSITTPAHLHRALHLRQQRRSDAVLRQQLRRGAQLLVRGQAATAARSRRRGGRRIAPGEGHRERHVTCRLHMQHSRGQHLVWQLHGKDADNEYGEHGAQSTRSTSEARFACSESTTDGASWRRVGRRHLGRPRTPDGALRIT